VKKVYLDANIIVALSAEKPKDEALEMRKNHATNALGLLHDSGVQLCVSSWALTEAVKVMIFEYGMPPKRVAILHNAITETSSVAGFEIKLIKTNPNSRYSVEDLFLSVREMMTNYNPGWGDAIHCVIMRNNKIGTILSSDTKDDFRIIPGLELLHPEKIKIND
jgi:predicted nucleic acid-binding protein